MRQMMSMSGSGDTDAQYVTASGYGSGEIYCSESPEVFTGSPQPFTASPGIYSTDLPSGNQYESDGAHHQQHAQTVPAQLDTSRGLYVMNSQFGALGGGNEYYTHSPVFSSVTDDNFKAKLSVIEQWFGVLSEAERTAALYSILKQTPQAVSETAPLSPASGGSTKAQVEVESMVKNMEAVFLDVNFKDKLIAIEQWLRVLPQAGRTTVIYSLLQHFNQDQIQLFTPILQQNHVPGLEELATEVTTLHDHVVLAIEIPAGHHRALIGHGSVHLNELQDHYGVQLHLPSSWLYNQVGKAENMANLKDVDLANIVKVSGPRTACEKAMEDLKKLNKPTTVGPSSDDNTIAATPHELDGADVPISTFVIYSPEPASSNHSSTT
ncbi:hypothetical protein MVEN_00406000 [Mycena venus]|uniref:K Homology domain-containing protein n=1 Tax=Mycena venus TaxID=2733690 RepID=A0A8H6YQE7_9AGAR|nr:hypothetical protein MVEN_00406000 [Mycena venus]